MKERIQELYEGLQNRLKSPFILTFMIVWSIHHWQLIAYTFTFDNDLSQGHKLEIIERYISIHNYWIGMFWQPVFWSLLSIMFYYLITILSKIISIGYNILLVNTYSRLNENRKLRTSEEFIEIEKKIKNLHSRSEILQKSNINLSLELESVEQKNIKLESQYQAANLKTEEKEKELQSEKTKLIGTQTEFTKLKSDLELSKNVNSVISLNNSELKNANSILITLCEDNNIKFPAFLKNRKLENENINTIEDFQAKFYINMKLETSNISENKGITLYLKYDRDNKFVDFRDNSTTYEVIDIGLIRQNEFKIKFVTRTIDAFSTQNFELTYKEGKFIYKDELNNRQYTFEPIK